MKLAYRDFSLREIHPHSEKAAEAARCAAEQGEFWKFHDALFANQSKLGDTELMSDARSNPRLRRMFRTAARQGSPETGAFS
jgi:hypothetical protein